VRLRFAGRSVGVKEGWESSGGGVQTDWQQRGPAEATTTVGVGAKSFRRVRSLFANAGVHFEQSKSVE
jgi:hypothetical protein